MAFVEVSASARSGEFWEGMMRVGDSFAGGGGTLVGAVQAGCEPVWAGNHDAAAVECLRRNFPGLRVDHADLMNFDWTTLPDLDVWMGSPECIGHTGARGKEMPHHDASRSTAWAFVQMLDVCRAIGRSLPRVLVVENVPAFRSWILYKRWRGCLRDLGYAIAEHVLEAGWFGCSAERARVIVVGVRGKRVPLLRWEKRPAVPALDVIDWHGGTWNPVEGRARELAVDTHRQIADGLARFGDRFRIRYNGRERRAGVAQDPRRPLGGPTTRDRFGLVRAFNGRPEFRMVAVREYARAMGFPDSHWLPEEKDAALRIVGNAVAPPMARAVLEQIQAKL